MDPQRYRLKLKKLDFISAVDQPAQETASVLLIKRRADADRVEGPARVIKVDDELGLVFCWAFTSKTAQGDYFDLHNDNIDQDFVAACAEFMAKGGATDEMHDSEPDGRVIFAMPMTPEIAKAYGVTTETVGLMVAIKPSPEVLAKFKSGEYTGVSIAGLGVREAIKSRAGSTIEKRSALTTAALGHTHLVMGYDESQSGFTSSEPMPGHECMWHSHPWVKAEGGAITIGVAMDHTHEVDNGVAARAPISTTAQPTPTVKVESPTTEPKMDPKDQQIATLSARTTALAKMLVLVAAMPEAQRAHFAKLAGDEAEAFLAKSATDREAAVAAIEKANEVVYTSTSTGEVFRKSDDPRLVTMAKRQDELAKDLAERTVEVEKQEIRGIAKARIPNLAGSDETHDYIVKSIRRGGGTTEQIEEALKSVGSGSTALAELAKAKGVNPGGPATPDSPVEAFNTELAKYAETVKKSVAQATGEFIRTTKGAELYVAAYPTVRE